MTAGNKEISAPTQLFPSIFYKTNDLVQMSEGMFLLLKKNPKNKPPPKTEGPSRDWF